MAIYKPTYCYPHGENIDLHVDPETKAIYLQCQVNTNNKRVTGYRLSLVDANGSVVWEPQDIAPISLLSRFDFGDARNDDHGTGLNGDTLIIPLVQNFKAVGGGSAGSADFTQQCLYTKIDKVVDYCFEYTGSLADISSIDAISEIYNWNISSDQDHQISVGARCLIKRSSSPYLGIYTLSRVNNRYELVFDSDDSVSVGNNIYVRYGNSNHGKVKKITSSNAYTNATDWIQYIDSVVSGEGKLKFEPLVSKLVDGEEYSWEITLYQGNISGDTDSEHITISTYVYHNVTQTTKPWSGSSTYYWIGEYRDAYNENQYDIMITQGQILGSNGSRLQIYPTDVVLQKYWVQLGSATRDTNGVITSWTDYGSRSNIQIYDSIYGHIYPQEGDFTENVIEENPTKITDCMVYKHSNNPDDVLASDKVAVATTPMSNGEIDKFITRLFNGGLTPQIDSYSIKQGDRVLVKDLTGYEYLNGVYVAYDTGTAWRRAGDFSDLGQFIGKIIMVENGGQNVYQNFESTVSSGGKIGRLTGSGIDAVRPQIGECFFAYYPNDTIDVDDGIRQYKYSSGRWSAYGSPMSFDTFLDIWGGRKVVLMSLDYFPSGNPADSHRYALPNLYYIPSDIRRASSDLISDIITNNLSADTVTASSILWIEQLTPAGGFLSFADYNETYQTWEWKVNQLSSDMTGDPIGFRPEQGVILYPTYENLTNTPSATSVDYLWVGDRTQNSNNITAYALLSDAGNATVISDISAISFDGVLGSELSTGTTIGSWHMAAQHANYTRDWSQLYPIECVFNLNNMPYSSDNPESVVLNTYLPTSSGSLSLGPNVTIGQSPKYYLGHSASPGPAVTTYRWELYRMYVMYDTFSYAYELVSELIVDFESPAQAGNSTKIFIQRSEAFEYVLSNGVGGLSLPIITNPSWVFGKYTVASNHSASFTAISGTEGSQSSAPVTPLTFHVNHGLVCGGENFLTIGTWENPQVQIGITNRVAKLNINNANTTYIKPAVGIEPGQYMVFTEVDNTTAPPRKIASFDDKLYAVTFDPSSSTVYSSVKNEDLKTPYKYKIMSYFKQGDYNPFTFSGEAKVGFLIPNSEYKISSGTGANQQFVLDGTIYEAPIEYAISVSNSNKGLTLDGFFNQGNGQRWRSYRMAIYSTIQVGSTYKPKDLIQDTGEIYEGDISQTFWGLRVQSNDNGNRVLYCILIVEDYYNDKYVVGATISISATGETLTCNNTIQYNYNLQSIDLVLSSDGSNHSLNNSYFYTIYRQEYLYGDTQYDDREYVFVSRQKPTNTVIRIRDYNITNGRKYIYFLQQEKNSGATALLTLGSTDTPMPITTPGKCWSIAELIPTNIPTDMDGVSTVRQYYAVDADRVWLLKYNADFGAQNQNFAKSENQTLGKYPRMGHGLRNNISGQVSALLGSEIKPGTVTKDAATIETQPGGYRERLRSRITGTRKSSNDSIDLLNAWREIAYSKNPKLLKDVKGQSWIVQITSNQNTPKSQVDGRPDTISFSWVQIDDPKGMVITGDLDTNINGDYK